MEYDDIKEINTFVIKRFRYVADSIVKDSWESHAMKLLESPAYIIKDDCDGLASTVAHLLHLKGATKVWRLMTDSTGGKVIDHMVAMVEDSTGQRWIVGDTMDNYPRKIQDYPGRILVFNDINKGIRWAETPDQ